MQDFTHETVIVKLENNKAVIRHREVCIPNLTLALLKGKGEGGSITIYKHLITKK